MGPSPAFDTDATRLSACDDEAVPVLFIDAPAPELLEIAEALDWAVSHHYHVKVLWATAKAKTVLYRLRGDEAQWTFWSGVLQKQSQLASTPKLQLLLHFHCQELEAMRANKKVSTSAE